MGQEHYFICRDDPFLLLGRDKWLTCQELAEGSHAIYSFPTAKQAQGVQAILPKAMKPGTKIRSAKGIEQICNLKFIPGRGFVRSETVDRGPRFEAPFRNESLIIFVLPGNGGSRIEEVPDAEQPEPVEEPLSEPPEAETPAIAKTAATSLRPNGPDGRDTTAGNDSVVMFEALLNTLEQSVRFRDEESVKIGERISTADREIMDELHYLEFNQLNAVDGFKVYQRLKDLRLKRRAAKDSAIIATYLSELIPYINQERLDTFWARLNGLKSRKYTLREPDTFIHKSEDGVIL